MRGSGVARVIVYLPLDVPPFDIFRQSSTPSSRRAMRRWVNPSYLYSIDIERDIVYRIISVYLPLDMAPLDIGSTLSMVRARFFSPTYLYSIDIERDIVYRIFTPRYCPLRYLQAELHSLFSKKNAPVG